MSTLALGLVAQLDAGATVHDRGLFDDQTIAVQLGDVATRVGQRDLVHLVGVQPDLAFPALENVGRQALLKSK